jgi:outer membrane protein assembly factor BamB
LSVENLFLPLQQIFNLSIFMKKLCLTLGCVALLSASFAQKTPDWTLDLEGTPKSVFIHDFTGIPVVETSTNFYGVDYPNKKILWKTTKSASTERMNQAAKVANMTGASAAAGVNLSETATFSPVPMSPYAIAGEELIEVSTGKVLQSGLTTVVEHDFLYDVYALLLKVKSGNNISLLYIDLEKKEVLWKKELGSDLGKQLAKIAGVGFTRLNAFAPQTTENGDIVYKYEKKLMLINAKDGTSKWENECNPGTFFVDNTQAHLVVVEQAGGIAGLSGAVAFGRNMFALDLASGKNLWAKPVELDERFVLHKNLSEDKFLVAHEDGLNIYSYKTGEATWKKDFKANNFKNVEIKNDGFEVLYGNKMMLVNKETGKEAWKKALKLDIPEDEEGNVSKKEYKKGMLVWAATYIGMFDYEKGKKMWKMSLGKDARIAIDEKGSRVAVLNGSKFFLFNPEELVKAPKALKIKIKEPFEITSFETRSNGYYLQGLNEYLFLDKDGNVLAQNYFKQLATDRLAKTMLMASSIATGGMSIEVTVSVNGGPAVTGGVFVGSAQTRAALADVSDAHYAAYNKLRNASKSSNDFGYFVKGEKTKEGDKMSLVKVDKNGGKEAGEFSLGSDRKVIYELMPNINLGFVVINNQLAVYNL